MVLDIAMAIGLAALVCFQIWFVQEAHTWIEPPQEFAQRIRHVPKELGVVPYVLAIVAFLRRLTEEQRRAYFQEQMGAEGGQAGQGAPRGRMGGGIDGEVLTVAPDQITVKISSGGPTTVVVK